MTYQEETLRRYADDNNYGVRFCYRDNGANGCSLERQGLQEMFSDIESGEVKRVIVLDMARLARDFIQIDKLMRYFNEHGVDLISVKDGGVMNGVQTTSESLSRVLLALYAQQKKQRRKQIV